jgi:DNA helicase HerA-like ATPase
MPMKQPRFIEIFELPDFLSDYTLAGQSESERMAHHWRRWTQSLGGLWTSQQSTFGIFFLWKAQQRVIHIYAGATSEESLRTLQVILQSIGIYSFGSCELKLGSYHKGFLISQGESRLHFSLLNKEFRQGPANMGQVVKSTSGFTDKFPKEFRLHENIEEGLQVIYQIHPFWGPGGAFLLPFDVIYQQQSDVLLCMLVKPYIDTYGLHEILRKLSDVSRECDSAAEQYIESPAVSGQKVSLPRRISDPQLKWCAQVYAAHLRRLTNPFLVIGACFSDDDTAARQVAQAVANSIHEERSFEPPAGEVSFLPQSAQVIPLESSTQEFAEKLLQLNMDEQDLIKISSPVLNVADRSSYLPAILRYLCDARGSATLFRFPVNINSGIPGVVVRQRPPDFHPGIANQSPRRCLTVPNSPQVEEKSISVGKLRTGDMLQIPLNDFVKHVLIVGTTGSGKTNTALNVICQLANHRIPFMVIEAAKKEYRHLALLEEMKGKIRIYTVGNELCSPIRINPFELLEGVRVEAHISRLQACFEAALPQDIGSLSSILNEALHKTYFEKGWDELDVYEHPDHRKFPTMDDFIDSVENIINERYSGEIQQNMRGVLLGRLKPFQMGSKRRTFNVIRSEPSIDLLFESNVIIELEELNLEEKALFSLFLITFLREYCDKKRRISSELQHITLIEEAHNVLEQVGSADGNATRADTRYKAVQAFCQTLAEIRAYGEGLIIVDQSPVKLARDAIRNTNIQIVHLLRDTYDRNAMTSAMIMDPLQSEYVGKLSVGEAAIFYPGLEKATFIRTNRFPQASTKMLGDNQVKEMMGNREVRPLPFRGCEFCEARCKHREDAEKRIRNDDYVQKHIQNYLDSSSKEQNPHHIKVMAREFSEELLKLTHGDADYAWCLLVQYFAEKSKKQRRPPVGIRPIMEHLRQTGRQHLPQSSSHQENLHSRFP